MNEQQEQGTKAMMVMGSTYHSYTAGEKRAFCIRTNQLLAGDPDLQAQLPLDPDTNDLFDVVSKGVLLWYGYPLARPHLHIRVVQ
jgi:hypothetical protein